MSMLAGLEHKKERVIPRRQFMRRMLCVAMLWLCLNATGLLLGMTGYAWTEGMGLVDAFVNAAMILSGMGPVTELKSVAGKLFAGFYAIFSGLFIVVATGFVLAPILHRVLHVLHVENGPAEKE